MHSGSQFKAIQPVIWEIKAVGAWAAVTVRKQKRLHTVAQLPLPIQDGCQTVEILTVGRASCLS